MSDKAPPQPANIEQRILDPEWGMKESARVMVIMIYVLSPNIHSSQMS